MHLCMHLCMYLCIHLCMGMNHENTYQKYGDSLPEGAYTPARWPPPLSTSPSRLS
jgi:hypothetical protein